MIGNATMFGQMATLMESLHLTYKEVFEEIPYRVLMLMSKDKLRPLTGDRVVKSTGKDMLARRGKIKKKKKKE